MDNNHTVEQKRDYIRGLSQKATPHELRRLIRTTFDVKKTRGNQIYNELFNAIPEFNMPIAPDEAVKIKTTEKPGELEASLTIPKVVQLEDVVKLCKVDLSKYTVKSFAVEEKAKGNFTWRVSFGVNKGMSEELSKELLENFVKNASSHAPKKWQFIRPAKDADCLYVIPAMDLHLAKLCWSPETGGADWDIRIAEKVYKDSIDDLMNKVPSDRIDEILLTIGSDFLQIDTDRSTTSLGTYVDSDTRLAKAFDVAAKLLTEVIEKLASKFKIRVISIPGNHDHSVSLFLSYYVAAWFKNHDNVIIDNSPLSRKYYGYGKTLLAFDHGDEAKLKDLPLIMMRENQAEISKYTQYEILTGHRHEELSEDIKGVVVRIVPALCPPDRWHSRKGLIGNVRRSQGFLYQKDFGLEAIYYSNPVV